MYSQPALDLNQGRVYTVFGLATKRGTQKWKIQHLQFTLQYLIVKMVALHVNSPVSCWYFSAIRIVSRRKWERETSPKAAKQRSATCSLFCVKANVAKFCHIPSASVGSDSLSRYWTALPKSLSCKAVQNSTRPSSSS